MSLSGEAVLYASSPSDKAAQENARKERRRRKIVKELFDTEKTYLQHLEIVSKFFEFPLRFACLVPEEVYASLFSNLEQIHDVNVTLLAQMEQSTIGQAFCELGPFLKLYSTYANNHQFALRTFQEWRTKSPSFANFIAKQEDRPEVKGLKLNALLIMPVQRIPRYKLLLEDLLENTPEEHHDYDSLKEAAEKMAEIAHHINEHIRQNENFMKMLAIQRSFYNSAPKLLVPGRQFIKEGLLKKMSRKGGKSFERMFFLFSDILLYGKSKFLDGGGSSYSCSCVLPLKHCRVEPVFITSTKTTEETGGAFMVTCKEESLVLYSDEQGNAQDWVNEMDKAIRKLCDDRQTLRRLSSNKMPLRGRSLRRHRQQIKKSESRIHGKTPKRPLSQCSIGSDMELDLDCSPNVKAHLEPMRRRFRQIYNNNNNSNNNYCPTVEEEENSSQLETCSSSPEMRKRYNEGYSTDDYSTADAISLSDTDTGSTSADDKDKAVVFRNRPDVSGGRQGYVSLDETTGVDGVENRQSIRQYSCSLRGSRTLSQEGIGYEESICTDSDSPPDHNDIPDRRPEEFSTTQTETTSIVMEASTTDPATAPVQDSSSPSSAEPYYPHNSPAHKYLNSKRSFNMRLRSYINKPLKRFQQAKKELSNPCSSFRSKAVGEKDDKTRTRRK